MCRSAMWWSAIQASSYFPSSHHRTLYTLLPDGVHCLHAVLPEMEGGGWTSDDFVRDFNVDYTLIMENLMDPDHGLFAHQVQFFRSWTCR
jgi:hypothetical protein